MQIPYLDLVTPPASEPLTLAEVKLALRVDGSSEDVYIVSLIKAARQAAEEYLRRSLVTQSWQLQFDSYAPKSVFLPKGPVQSVTFVKSIAQDWSETTVSSNAYRLNAGKDQLIFNAAPIGMIIQIKYVTGFGDSTDVPYQLKQGMLAHIAAMYENRDGNCEMPPLAKDLYASYKVVKI